MAAKVEIVKINPKSVQVMFMNSLPYFINEDFSTKNVSLPDYYLTKNVDFNTKEIEELKIKANQKINLETYKNGPLRNDFECSHFKLYGYIFFRSVSVN